MTAKTVEKQETAIDTIPETGLEQAPPDYLKEYESEEFGIEFEIGDLKLSRLALASNVTDEVMDGTQTAGDFFDKVTGKSFGKEMEIIILKTDKSWAKFTDEKKLEARSEDGKYWDNGEELTLEEKWKCKSHVFTILLANQLDSFPMLLYFNGTGTAAADAFLDLTAKTLNKKYPIHIRTCTLSSKIAQGKKGKYFTPSITWKGWATQDQAFKASQLVETIKGVKDYEKIVAPDGKLEEDVQLD